MVNASYVHLSIPDHNGVVGSPYLYLTQNEVSTNSFSIEEARGPQGKPLRIAVKVMRPETAAAWQVLVFKNLPDTISLSPGTRLNNEQYIAFYDLGRVTISAAAGYQGESELLLSFIGKDKTLKEHHRLKIQFARGEIVISEVAEAATKSDADTSGTENPTYRSAGISADQENTFLARAEKLIQLGQIAAARLLLEHLANHGSMRGALRLGESYDSRFLRSLNVIGAPQSDQGMALKWYERAEKLGSADAAERIKQLK